MVGQERNNSEGNMITGTSVKDPKVRMLTINWRLFGSQGKMSTRKKLALQFELICNYCNKPMRLWKNLELEELASYVSFLP